MGNNLNLFVLSADALIEMRQHNIGYMRGTRGIKDLTHDGRVRLTIVSLNWPDYDVWIRKIGRQQHKENSRLKNILRQKKNSPKSTSESALTFPKSISTLTPTSDSKNNTSCPLLSANGNVNLPRGYDGSKEGIDENDYYETKVLLHERAIWYRYQTCNNWRSLNTNHVAKEVLTWMEPNGKFDAIKLVNGALEVVGRQDGPTNPNDHMQRAGNYLLCNGAFFKMGKPKQYYPIGQTSSTTNVFPIDPLYANDYQQISNSGGSQYLMSGPSLLEDLDLTHPRFHYWGEHEENPWVKIPGSLAHGFESNERLVYGKVGHDLYIFTYTSDERAHGVDFNQMRGVIIAFMKKNVQGFQNFDQLTNLDGGGSIFVSWTHGNVSEMIAQGNKGDETPGMPPPHPREVVNFLKISVS
ncbi:hypothetical protein B0J11DRAFT_587319 [Dendryphion nanum]|uniref:Phosphodiester glycosidase domain-containing protein n=1 Tax=Dendryphion nanum TaxID=256645 RepID=A0A9P9EJZ3_9PLEO|nr:hypothetical protein B0J11DRAFT_587319 [Dendryphion nanum]